MSKPEFRGATIEIIDRGKGPSLIRDRVLINGVEVGLLAEGGLVISPVTPNDIVTVTLILIPDKIVIRHEDEP